MNDAGGDGGEAALDEEVPEALAGERLDRFVALGLGCSRSQAAELVESGAVLVGDEAVVVRSHRLEAGDQVTCTAAPATSTRLVEADASVVVPVVAVDAAFLVVDKPAGMVVHPGAGQDSGTMVQGLLAAHPELAGVGEPHRPGVVHRLDKGTTGLLVVARTPEAHARLVDDLARRAISRRYRAVVWGLPEDDRAEVDAPIGRSARDRTRMAVRAGGKPARTRYRVLARHHDPVEVAELVCELDTGRTHQIRVHLAAIGHPVVGDARYGGQRDSLPFDRPALHAAELAFPHPSTGELVRFESPLPADLAQLVAPLR